VSREQLAVNREQCKCEKIDIRRRGSDKITAEN
jgi:hypothetical protein